MSKNFVLIIIAGFIFSFDNPTFCQNNEGQFHGNFQTDFQYYLEDTIIGATVPKEKIGLNSYANFNYTKGNFSAGVRYEGYFPPLNGFDNKYEGVGLPYKYAGYKTDKLDFIVGNFYEQFGSGLILRTYEEKNLGYDNAFEGVRVKYNIYNGIYLKALVGKQRYYWETSDGIVRGADAEILINETFAKLKGCKTVVMLGGSFVSKYQEDFDPFYKMPENVAAYSGRINLTTGKININSEYAYKMNDPSADNKIIYKPGNAFILNASYSQKGLGILLGAKRIDNMSFRSDRNATLADLNINYIPDITKATTYLLAAMYPYGTQLNGEIGVTGEITYKIPKNTFLGGENGMGIAINYTIINSIDKEQVNDTIPIGQTGTDGYKSDFFTVGDELFFQDFSFELNKKISKKLKGVLKYQNQAYNNLVIHGAGDWHGMIYTDIIIADFSYKLTSKKTLRAEGQVLFSDQHYGSWTSGLLEYSFPNWFFTVIDQYNFGNPDEALQVHYPNFSIGYTKGSSRIQIGYGKQRNGVMCIGGVCRVVPAANGLMLTISSSF